MPAEDVVALYLPHKDFAFSFWVWIIRGLYKNDVGYVLLCNEDKVEILLVPQECPYDNNHGRRLQCGGNIRYQGCDLWPPHLPAGVTPPVFCKADLGGSRSPHPDDLAFHHLAGINPPLIQQTVALFSVQLWQEGDLVCILQGEFVNTCGSVLAVDMQNKTATIKIDAEDGLKGQYYFSISHLQCMHRRGDSVKVFVGPDKGAEGFVVALGDNLTIAVRPDGEDIEVSPKSLKKIPGLILG